MPLRNKEYGGPADCEVDGCDRTRGASLHCVYSYGCVLCTHHESQLQLGRIDLPESASDSRKATAADKVLG